MVEKHSLSAADRSGLANAGLSVKALGVQSRLFESTAASSGHAADVYRLRNDPSEMPYKFCDTEARKNALKINGCYAEKDPVLHYMMHNSHCMFKSKRVMRQGDWLATQRERG